MHVIEVEDEHAEARFVAAEIAGLVEEGYSADEVAVFYRTNAQSRVLEDVLVRQGIAYQVIGGPRFYERAEIKDADRLPPGDRQPVRRRLAAARRQPPPARDRQLDALQAPGVCRRARDAAVRGARLPRGGRRRRCAAEERHRASHAARLAPVGGAGADRPGADRSGARAQRLPRVARGGADDRVAGADGEPPGARRRRRASTSSRRRSRACPASSRRSRSTPTRTRSAASRASSR